MIAIFILHLIILFCCIGTGFLFYEITGTATTNRKSGMLHFITGLIALTSIAQVIELFYPVNAMVQGALFAGLLAALAIRRKTFGVFASGLIASVKAITITGWIIIAAGWLLVLLIGAGFTINSDTDNYHIQMVKWIADYGTVPGLANLHSRYGFNSSWFTSTALLTPSGIPGQYYTALNSLVSVLFIFYMARRLTHPLIAIPAAFVLMLILTAWPVIRGNAASAGYDLFTALVILVLFTESVTAVAASDGSSAKPVRSATGNFAGSTSLPLAEMIFWPVYLFSIRITNFPMMLLSLGACWLLWRSHKKATAVLMGYGLLLVIPFLVRNVMLSGYLFYPSRAFDFFGVDWKADAWRTDWIVFYIRQYNRVGSGYQTIETTAAMTTSEWVVSWFRLMFTYDKRIFLIGIAGFLAAAVALIRRVYLRHRVYFLWMTALLGQLVLWFTVAPDPRFVYGPLLCGCLLLPLILVPASFKWKSLATPLVTALSVALLAYTVYMRKADVPRLAIRPFDLPSPEVTTVYFKGVPVTITCMDSENSNEPCYDSKLPCTYEVYPGLEARGTSVSDGFRLSDNRDSTKAIGL